MTGRNWPGFEKNDQRVGKQFFVLLDDAWPSEFEIPQVGQGPIVHRIESLFQEIHLHAGH
jgi:hypothetical protein